MSPSRNGDRVIAAFFAQAQPELPDRVFDAVRRDIEQTSQRRFVGRRVVPGASTLVRFGLAAVAILAVGLAWNGLLFRGPVGAPTVPPSPTPAFSAEPSVTGRPAGPTSFASPLYGYRLTLPPGWIAAAAIIPWDGVRQPGPDADVDKFAGPAELSAFGFAGPTSLDLDALVADRIAANARDHADTCPADALEVNEPIVVGEEEGVLLGWDCGALINQAVAVHAGVAYAFTFRDLSISTSRDPADGALFRTILDSVAFPTDPTPAP